MIFFSSFCKIDDLVVESRTIPVASENGVHKPNLREDGGILVLVEGLSKSPRAVGIFPSNLIHVFLPWFLSGVSDITA
jgi:hypothetical protein